MKIKHFRSLFLLISTKKKMKYKGNGKVSGAVKNRTQFYNSRTGCYYKQDENGKIIGGGKKTKYKNISIKKKNKKKKK